MTLKGAIIEDPDILSCEPVFRGTRVPFIWIHLVP
jgi:uncharacterized protein (DUF433 family)